MAELLLELLSEEIPARMQAVAASDLRRLVTDGLTGASLEFSSARAYVTPRRIALVVDGLPVKQPDVTEERRGPRADAPEKARRGFCSSLPAGVPVEERETEKGPFLYATIERHGEKTETVLPGLIGRVLTGFPWPKSMRWGTESERWVRPLHGIVCLLGGTVVPLTFAGVRAGNMTHGHRFLSPEAFSVGSFDDYASKLRGAKVILDALDRRSKIETEATSLAMSEGLRLREDPGLLDEVSGLVEWPVVLIGSIDERFMALPDEVLAVTMRTHQKYLACLRPDGSLANRFIVVANNHTSDDAAGVISGNERVLRARLADAEFFWNQDRTASLTSRLPALEDRVFHARLGSLKDKADRLEPLAALIAASVEGADHGQVISAARLAKADLLTGMVGEFPELQGVMGRYYALNDGVTEAVADAIADHYSPLGPNDTCPTRPVSICVALADKVDTLVGLFAIGERPTGSKDPFALRRAALGIIRLVLENDLPVALRPVLRAARGLYSNLSDPTDEILAFLADRLKVHLRDGGVRHDVIDAVFALGGEDDLVRLIARARAVQDFLGTNAGQDLLTAYRRGENILRIEEKRDKCSHRGTADPALFGDDVEHVLASRLRSAEGQIEGALVEGRFSDAMVALADLREPVDAFFDGVKVNDGDAILRANRLRLLSGVGAALDGVADFSRIEG